MMSSLSLPASRSRPVAITVAVVLSALMVIANFASPVLPSGSGDDKVPTSVIVIGFVLGVLGIGVAVGLWMLRKWGYIATIVVSAVNLLLAAPGIAFGPGAGVRVLCVLVVLVCAAIIVLVTRPEARRAYL